MTSCGRTIGGYIKTYGSAHDPGHSGDGGEAIYAADIAALSKLMAERDELGAKLREDELRREARA